ncbi:MAG: Z1 domain-containing protein, partial [Burkholderia sp.]|nr:Z1 domain-containing protein [Burkholderia sp.]
LVNDIRQYLAADEIWTRHNRLTQLHQLYELHYAECGFSWDVIRLQLHDSVASVKVLTINQKTEAENKLNYRQYKNTDKGRRVIAVGGMTLSRGLTLEGLCVSYFYRHSKAYDTLLQMARWFGYRPGYDDLCRVWMDEEAQVWFTRISEAVAELRSDLRHMYINRLPPSRFGIRVKSHPDLLLVTAKNKMRNAADVELSASFSNTLIETTALLRGPEANERNVSATRDFVAKLGAPETVGKRFEWKEVDASAVATYLSAMSISALNQGFIPDARTGEQPLVSFIKEKRIAKLEKWVVCVVQAQGAEAESIKINECSDATITPRKRLRSFEIPRLSNSATVRINKHRLGDASDERIGLDP